MKKIISLVVFATIMALCAINVFAADTENYFCDFSAENANFKCYQPSESNGFIEDGKLTMAVYWPTMVNLDNHSFGDGTYEFDMSVGTDKDWAGVMFCKTNPEDIWDHSGYMFYVRTDGNCDLLVATVGVVASAYIDADVTAENHYKIVKDGESIKVYFEKNETPIIEVTDNLYTEGYFSFVSSSAGTNTHATLDNLSIKIPETNINTNPEDTPDESEEAPQTGFAAVALMVAVIGSGAYIVSKKH